VAEPSRPLRTNSRCCLGVSCPSKHRSKRRQQLTARTWSNTRPQYLHLPSRSPFSVQLACTIMTPDNLDCGCRTDSGALSVVRRRPIGADTHPYRTIRAVRTSRFQRLAVRSPQPQCAQFGRARREIRGRAAAQVVASPAGKAGSSR
jgi:hypothetical protein